MYNVAGAATVTNCILWTGSDDAVDSSYAPACDASYRCCDVKGSGGSGEQTWDTDIGRDGGGNIDASPSFALTVDSTNFDADGEDNVWMTGDDGLRVTWKAGQVSPCLDEGDGDAAPDLDISGFRRCDVGTEGGGYGTPDYVDIGAYEGGPTVVVMCWIDESGPIPDYSTYRDTGGLGRWLDDLLRGVYVGEDYYESYRELVLNKKLLAVRSGCLVPSGQPHTGYYGTIADVFPIGYFVDSSNPPDLETVEGMSVRQFPRREYDGGVPIDPPLELESFTDSFDEVRESIVPDYVVLVVDTSGSLQKKRIETGYSEKPDDNFVWWLAQTSNYPNANITRVDGTDERSFTNERWVEAIDIELDLLVGDL
jgi:hypothetical protein